MCFMAPVLLSSKYEEGRKFGSTNLLLQNLTAVAFVHIHNVVGLALCPIVSDTWKKTLDFKAREVSSIVQLNCTV